MATKFLYLDDEDLNLVKPVAESVEGKDAEIVIDIVHPAKFESNFSELIKKLKDYQGLILDWRLDVISDPDLEQKFTFRAGAIAQEIRNRENDDKEPIAPFPIVLWSTQEKLAASFNRDHTAHDLFDGKYIKDDIGENPKRIREELLSLVSGYEIISKFSKKSSRNISDLLGTDKNFLDIRIQERFSNGHFPVHEYARFIKREIIDRPGPLVEEYRLAARLGIDKDESKDWSSILDLLDEHRYTGPFNDAWPRWWIYAIEKNWWITKLAQTKPIGFLSADERVKAIKDKTGLKKLVSANPIMQTYHSKFNTICEHCHKPLDPIDGVILDEKEPEPWQERKYVSLDVALERREGFSPHPTELERLRKLRQGK
jgi:hypothetical protein